MERVVYPLFCESTGTLTKVQEQDESSKKRNRDKDYPPKKRQTELPRKMDPHKVCVCLL